MEATISVNNSPYPREQVLQATDDFVYMWQQEFGDDIRWTIEDLRIYFVPKTEKEWFSPGCIRGETDRYNFSYINVAYISEKEWPLYETAFWHELIHVVFGKTTGDPDSNHDKFPGSWTKEHDNLDGKLKKMWKEKSSDLESQEMCLKL